jgi:hypothetical protein
MKIAVLSWIIVSLESACLDVIFLAASNTLIIKLVFIEDITFTPLNLNDIFIIAFKTFYSIIRISRLIIYGILSIITLIFNSLIMNIPEGAKFVFFLVPVFLVTAALVIFFFNKNDSTTESVKEGDLEEIYGSESDSEESFDFDQLNIEILKEGEGKEAEVGDEVSVHYTGTLIDGTKFDSSYDRGEPFTFVLGIGQVIDGWDQGIVGMKVGEQRVLEIPSGLGYGEFGSGPIPGGAGLVFETELVAIN